MLTFSADHKVEMSIVMAEHPFQGTWSRDGNEITVPELGSGHFLLESRTKLVPKGPLSSTFSNEALYKMSAEWIAGMNAQSKIDGYVKEAEDIAECAVICAGDYDDTLPASAQEFEKRMMPYIVYREKLAHFTYTYTGGKLPPERQRSSCELGFTQVEGGEVHVYADGSAKWTPNR